MTKFLRNLSIILLPFYALLFLLNSFFHISKGFRLDPLALMAALTNYIDKSVTYGQSTLSFIIAIFIMILPSYIALFLKLFFFKNKKNQNKIK
ncbi:MAG: hypothetical protein ACRC0S_09090 [Fusobacteriaceae bacterium]